MDYQANYKKQVDALRNEAREVLAQIFQPPLSSFSILLLQVDDGHGAILNNLKQQINDRGGGGWQYQVCSSYLKCQRLKTLETKVHLRGVYLAKL